MDYDREIRLDMREEFMGERKRLLNYLFDISLHDILQATETVYGRTELSF